MGCFSWMESKVKTSNIEIGDTVYMLSPNGEHVVEYGYDGYGRFGSINPGIHIYNINMRTKEELEAELANECYAEANPKFMQAREDIGYAIMDDDGVYEDIDTKVRYSFHHCFPDLGILPIRDGFATIQDGYTNPPNELIGMGQWKEIGLREHFLGEDKEYNGLKFSRDKDANFDDYVDAQRDPTQGVGEVRF